MFMTAIKIFDFFLQAVPIIWMFSGIFSGKFQGQGFLAVIMVEILILPYQFISSLVIGIPQFLEHKLSKTGMFSLILCVSIVGLLLLMFVASHNCLSVKDILTFSNKEVTDYMNYYAIHKGEKFVSTLCDYLDASNNIFVTETLFIFWMIPLFFILTLIERFIDVSRKVKEQFK